MMDTHRSDMRGELCGQPLSPVRILDGIADRDGRTFVMPGSPSKRKALDAVPVRALLVGMAVIGVLCLTGYASYVASVMGRSVLARTIDMVVAPVLSIISGGTVALKGMSFDDEHDVHDTLVSDGSHVVHIRTCSVASEATGGEPIIRVTMTHAKVGDGKATRTLGGISVSNAERYEIELSPRSVSDADAIIVGDEAYVGSGSAFIPDIFESPLSETFEGWVTSDEWIWATPISQDNSDRTPVPEAKVRNGNEGKLLVAVAP